MSFIDKAMRKQTKIELKLIYFIFWKIGSRFLLGLIAVSLFAYALLVGCYFVFVKHVNLFTTCRIPAMLNPVNVSFIGFCIIVILYLKNTR